METENISIDYSGKRKVIEKRGKVLPDVGISIFSKALIVESVDLSNLLRLVVASENGDSIGVSNLESNKECDRLDGVVSSIDIVTHEQVVVGG